MHCAAKYVTCCLADCLQETCWSEELESWSGAWACCGIWASELAVGVVEVATEELEDWPETCACCCI